jgi:hypothetical protein
MKLLKKETSLAHVLQKHTCAQHSDEAYLCNSPSQDIAQGHA